MNFIYENICRETKLEEISKLFDNSFRVKDFDNNVPDSGVFIGSIEGCRWIQENRPNVKTWSTFDNYLCSNYYPKINKYLFNDRYAFIPFEELSRRKWDLYSWLGKECLLFIRPNSGEKDFPAELVDLEDIDKLVDNYDYDGLAVVSTPKNNLGEWRFVVDKDGIIAVSCYRFQGISCKIASAPTGAHELVEKVLDLKWYPDDLFCIDVIEDMSGNFWVVEITSFSSAGLYGCNAKLIKEAILKHAA